MLIAALEARGIACLRVPEYPGLPAPVACHADLQLCHLGGARIAVAAGAGQGRAFWRPCGNGAFPLKPQGRSLRTIPGDVPLNCCGCREGLHRR